MKIDTRAPKPELCGIEFFSRKRYKEFIRLNPLLQNTARLTAENHIMILVMLKDSPTRGISEFYDSDGRAIGKFIGPDALE